MRAKFAANISIGLGWNIHNTEDLMIAKSFNVLIQVAQSLVCLPFDMADPHFPFPYNSSYKLPRKKKEVKKRGGGFTKLCSLSPELQKFTGVPELARTEVVQTYSDTIDMFQMNKALAKHIWPLDSDGAASTNSAPKEKQRKQERDEDQDEPKRKEKRQRGGNSAFLAPLKLSDALAKFLGTGESALPRSDVVKRIWEYIKLNNLQDPSDKRQIICDEKLKELFNVDTFCGFTVAKLLTAHLVKTEQ
ncbi:UNVERIFIED_CONTAM: Upstream activation factor subunit spp27 [Sesamum calycinum]|uniref:Upstream activation factor subunit spp27 n=1 Tax=Sesamum calycinum TaxID=2727403 RepID=A0AAW2LRR1_9LAMI